MHKFEESSIKQFDWWAKNQNLFLFWFSFLNKQIAKIVNPKVNSSLLDVGCGWGLLLTHLSASGRNLKLYGIDISPLMVSTAKSAFKNVKNVEILEGSADNLPYEDNMFDYVTCILSFHHHPDSLKSLKEMHRVLKPHGKLILLDQCNNGLLRKLLLKIVDLFFQEKDTHIYAKEEMLEMFSRTGFINSTQRAQNYYRLLTVGEKK